MKKALIISPYFPPSNAADMQRIRMSLPYFKKYGWDVEVVQVKNEHSDMVKDPLLLKSIPEHIKIHEVDAFSKRWTSKIGLGSLALRSMWYYREFVNTLLKREDFDLIYFSTTQFPLCILGAYWKYKFGIPYVIDMQDPWHSEYYQNKPKNEPPRKYWLSYRLNKYLEPIAMKSCDGLISVSESYLKTLKSRYNNLKDKPMEVITFGSFEKDFELVQQSIKAIPLAFSKQKDFLHIVYIGRGGPDMKNALKLLFSAVKRGLESDLELFSKLRFFFIGTSYAPAGQGIPTVLPIAQEEGVDWLVTEQTDRIPFYSGLASLLQADGLVVPGSNDPGYTASKLYPYIMAKKPFLGLFHENSSAVKIVRECNTGEMITLNENADIVFSKLMTFLNKVSNQIAPETNWMAFEPYTAKAMTQKQCDLFNIVVEAKH